MHLAFPPHHVRIHSSLDLQRLAKMVPIIIFECNAYLYLHLIV